MLPLFVLVGAVASVIEGFRQWRRDKREDRMSSPGD